MFGAPKGYVIVSDIIQHSKAPGTGPEGEDLTKLYFDALKMKIVPVIDIAVDGEEYLVLGNSAEIGWFLWTIDKRDTISSGVIPYNLLHPVTPNVLTLLGLSDDEKVILISMYKSLGLWGFVEHYFDDP